MAGRLEETKREKNDTEEARALSMTEIEAERVKKQDLQTRVANEAAARRQSETQAATDARIAQQANERIATLETELIGWCKTIKGLKITIR